MKPSTKLKWLEVYMREYIESYPMVMIPFTEFLKEALKGNTSNRSTKNSCRYCYVRYNNKIYRTRDHIHPTSKGGSNRSDNRTYACQYCNGWKSNHSLERWIALIKEKMCNDTKGKFHRKRTQMINSARWLMFEKSQLKLII